MRQDLLELLICPACLPHERPLRLAGECRAAGEIVAGTLGCRACGRDYPVADGLPMLLPEPPPPTDKYQLPATLSAYLWSHYAELAAEPDASPAYRQWAALVPGGADIALDLGCAVGRMSFELAAAGGLAIGIDRSLPLVRAGRELARTGSLDYSLTLEGRLCEPRRIELPTAWRAHPPEFLIADALALPFPAGIAERVCSLNLLDKVPSPRRHLAECNRVARTGGARLLCSDPFSWSPEHAPEEEWLGGTTAGPYSGSGLDNVRRILEAEFQPPWLVAGAGIIPWTIRNHRNHFELIRSQYLLAER